MSPSPPRLRGYRVRQLLGAGRQGTVWLAEPRGAGPAVAVKHVPRRLGGVLPEAEALAALDHPNLIKVRAVHRQRHGSVLVMDLAAGGTLAELLARRRLLPAGEVVATLVPVASALGAVHAAGLVHGDLSPSNVLFGADGLPLLSDLGSAYWLDDGSPLSVPASGFADPLVEHGVVTGQAGDVFGLAALAFAALTGSVVPVPTDIDAAGRAAFATACRGSLMPVPPDLSAILLGALALDVRSRPSAVEFAAGLRWAAPMTGVDLHAGRHTVLSALPVITRGARIPVRADDSRSRSPRHRRWGRMPRDTQPPRPSR